MIALIGSAASDLDQSNNDAQHVPQLPVAEPAPLPLLALTLVAAGSIAVGLAALRRRDIG